MEHVVVFVVFIMIALFLRKKLSIEKDDAMGGAKVDKIKKTPKKPHILARARDGFLSFYNDACRLDDLLQELEVKLRFIRYYEDEKQKKCPEKWKIELLPSMYKELERIKKELKEMGVDVEEQVEFSIGRYRK